ncbi:MAG: SAM-dependent methyltransferase, partial [Burkholderiales bacterium]
LWIVPAKVAGDYRLPQGDLVLRQKFQMLSGTLSAGGRTYELEGGRVRGEEITFRAGGREYRGRVKGKDLELR